jgi:hypothetical protein
MGLLVWKYTSYAILVHQAAEVMQPVVFVFIHNDNNKFDVGRQSNFQQVPATTVFR